MSDIKRIGDLEINQDLDFQQKEWTAEHMGWLLMALFILAGLIGLLGPGPISQTTAEKRPIRVEYRRFDRVLAPLLNIKSA